MNGLPLMAGLGRRRETGVIRHRSEIGFRATARAYFLMDSPFPPVFSPGFLVIFTSPSFPRSCAKSEDGNAQIKSSDSALKLWNRHMYAANEALGDRDHLLILRILAFGGCQGLEDG